METVGDYFWLIWIKRTIKYQIQYHRTIITENLWGLATTTPPPVRYVTKKTLVRKGLREYSNLPSVSSGSVIVHTMPRMLNSLWMICAIFLMIVDFISLSESFVRFRFNLDCMPVTQIFFILVWVLPCSSF